MNKVATAAPRLVVISAPSGAGKTTLCRKLLQDFPNVVLSISATTRARRPKEVDGVDYEFLSPHEFETKKNNGEFAEWANVHNHAYGTPKANIEKALASGKNVLFDIDVQGAKSLQKQYPEQALLIFVHPPSMEELETRLRRRKGDSSTAIERRLQNAYDELEWSKSFDYQITNDQLEIAYQQLKEIIKKECP